MTALRADSELQTIRRVMGLLTGLTPVSRARVLDYVVSRVDSLDAQRGGQRGPQPQPEEPDDDAEEEGEELDFTEVEPAPRAARTGRPTRFTP